MDQFIQGLIWIRIQFNDKQQYCVVCSIFSCALMVLQISTGRAPTNFRAISKCQRIQGSSRGRTRHTGTASGGSEETSRRTLPASTVRSELTVFRVGLDCLMKTPHQVNQISNLFYTRMVRYQYLQYIK